MDFLTAAALLAAGIACGILSGALALEEGAVLVPVLLLLLRGGDVSSLIATHVAIGTSLLVTAVSSALPAWKEWRLERVTRAALGVIAGAAAAGALGGAFMASGLEGSSLGKIIAAALCVAAMRLFGSGRRTGKPVEELPPAGRLALTGFLPGILTSLTGIAGGALTPPLLRGYLRLPQARAGSLAAAARTGGSLAGAASFLVMGWGNAYLPQGLRSFIDWERAVPLCVGAIAGALAAPRVAPRVNSPWPRRTIAVLLLLAAVRLAFA